MKTLTLLMIATTGLITPVALEGTAFAGRATQTMVLGAPEQDTAPTANGRLRRTNEEQPGTEMASVVLLDDGTGKRTKGLFFSMRTELPPTADGQPVRKANHRVQLSLTPFTLSQDAAGSVVAVANAPASKFVTNNDGNEYRNANAPHAFALTSSIACVDYNYQANNSNDTKRYTQCFDADGQRVLDQTLIMAKNNDDCSMHQTTAPTIAQTVNNRVYVVKWHGCNGNGRDNGWAQLESYDISNPTALSFKREFDLTLAQREERSRGFCSVAASDPNTAICTWTEGNNQPQRDGVWIGAIDITPGKFSGSDQQDALLWKEQLGGRVEIQGKRTYSMRIAHTRIMQASTTNPGQLEPSDQMLVYFNRLRGNNNENQKGGTVLETPMGVIKADKTGMSYVLPLQDTSRLLKGLGGTHLGMNAAVFGTTDNLQAGAIFTNGSHTGGYFNGQARSLIWDQAQNQFIDGGMTATAESDRHLYSNYLGNNPGNQGRNHDSATMIANPFAGVNGNTDAFLLVLASSGKPMAELGQPEKKLSGYLSVIPVASTPTPVTPDPTTPGSGSDDGDGSDDGQTPPDDNTDDGGGAAGAQSLGGCSTGGATGGAATLLLIGLAAFIRRRR